MKTRMIAMVLACCSTMTAQISNYLGPGILTRGAGDIGTRAGQDVDLRFFAGVYGIYDTGLQPFLVDSNGQLETVNGVVRNRSHIGSLRRPQFPPRAAGTGLPRGPTGITPVFLSTTAPIIRWRSVTPTRNRGAWFSICVRRPARSRKARFFAGAFSARDGFRRDSNIPAVRQPHELSPVHHGREFSRVGTHHLHLRRQRVRRLAKGDGPDRHAGLRSPRHNSASPNAKDHAGSEL